MSDASIGEDDATKITAYELPPLNTIDAPLNTLNTPDLRPGSAGARACNGHAFLHVWRRLMHLTVSAR